MFESNFIYIFFELKEPPLTLIQLECFVQIILSDVYITISHSKINFLNFPYIIKYKDLIVKVQDQKLHVFDEQLKSFIKLTHHQQIAKQQNTVNNKQLITQTDVQLLLNLAQKLKHNAFITCQADNLVSCYLQIQYQEQQHIPYYQVNAQYYQLIKEQVLIQENELDMFATSSCCLSNNRILTMSNIKNSQLQQMEVKTDSQIYETQIDVENGLVTNQIKSLNTQLNLINCILMKFNLDDIYILGGLITPLQFQLNNKILPTERITKMRSNPSCIQLNEQFEFNNKLYRFKCTMENSMSVEEIQFKQYYFNLQTNQLQPQKININISNFYLQQFFKNRFLFVYNKDSIIIFDILQHRVIQTSIINNMELPTVNFQQFTRQFESSQYVMGVEGLVGANKLVQQILQQIL